MLVAVRDLKSNLLRILAQAQAGEVIEVISHQTPIARIIGIPAMTHSGLDQGLGELIGNGTLSWSGGKPRFAPPLQLDPTGCCVSQMLLDDRR